MSTIAEFSLPVEEFPLGNTLAALPEVDAEVERVADHDADRVTPYIWFSGPDADVLSDLDDRLESDPSVEGAELLTDLGDERLYRMHWIEDVILLRYVLDEEEATVLNAAGERSRWQLRVLLPEREALSRIYEFATDRGLSLEIGKIHELDGEPRRPPGLTDAQHETLVTALEGGYYEIPRDADMAALSADLGISHQALSERLRRAHRALVEDAVEIGNEDGN